MRQLSVTHSFIEDSGTRSVSWDSVHRSMAGPDTKFERISRADKCQLALQFCDGRGSGVGSESSFRYMAGTPFGYCDFVQREPPSDQ
jgi:hypothetical protein